MIPSDTLATIAQLGLGLAGFSGIALVLTRGGGELTPLEAPRLGVMLRASLGATFLAVLPLVLPRDNAEAWCRFASAVFVVFTAHFLLYYVGAIRRIRAAAPELVTGVPFAVIATGHAINLILQIMAAADVVDCLWAYPLGLFWLLFHGAYQFSRILFIRPRPK